MSPENEDDHGDSVYEEVDLADMTYEEDDDTYYYECPCGDMFEITKVRRSLSLHPNHN